MKDIQLVIFDMDGVVFDSEKVYFAANKAAADRLGMSYDFEYYRQFVGGGTEPMLAKMAKDYGSRELIDKFISLSNADVHPIVEAGNLELKKGFTNLINFLKANNIDYVLASSNVRSEIEFFLEHTGQESVFDKIVSFDDADKAKPDPEIFIKAWELAGKPNKNQCLVIEDSLNGVKAANNADIPVIKVPDIVPPVEYEEEHTVAILDSLDDVIEYIEK